MLVVELVKVGVVVELVLVVEVLVVVVLLVDVVLVLVDEVAVVEVEVVLVWLNTCPTSTKRRLAPLCEIDSTMIFSLESVRSMKPYWSSFPAGSGACSEVTPPPPPETTHDIGSKKSV